MSVAQMDQYIYILKSQLVAADVVGSASEWRVICEKKREFKEQSIIGKQ